MRPAIVLLLMITQLSGCSLLVLTEKRAPRSDGTECHTLLGVVTDVVIAAAVAYYAVPFIEATNHNWDSTAQENLEFKHRFGYALLVPSAFFLTSATVGLVYRCKPIDRP